MHSKDLDSRSSLNQQYMGKYLQALCKSRNEIQTVSVVNLRQKLKITDKQFTLTQYKWEA